MLLIALNQSLNEPLTQCTSIVDADARFGCQDSVTRSWEEGRGSAAPGDPSLSATICQHLETKGRKSDCNPPDPAQGRTEDGQVSRTVV